MEEASEYIQLRKQSAAKIALATFLCVISPICLIFLSALSERQTGFAIREEIAAGMGLCVLLVLVAIAVAIFISCGSKAKAYEFLDYEPFETAYGVRGMVREKLAEHQGDYTRENKRKSKLLDKISTIYWLTVTAIFLFYTFGPYGSGQPQYSWFIWAVAGVLYGAVVASVKLVRK